MVSDPGIEPPSMLVRKYVDENGSGATQAAKRSAGVAPEVNIREYVTSLVPLPNANKAAHSGFETQRRHHHKSKTVSVPTKGHMSTEKFKKTTKETMVPSSPSDPRKVPFSTRYCPHQKRWLTRMKRMQHKAYIVLNTGADFIQPL